MKITMMQLVSVLAIAASFAFYAHAYQYPILINQNRMQKQQAIESRSDDSMQISKPDETETQQLRQLHQVVDTMAQLLNEQEQNHELSQQTNSGPNMHDLMSESEIKLALEELEKVQKQEREAAESRQRPMIAEAPQTLQVNSANSQQQSENLAQQDKKESAYDTLLDQLDDELIDEQLNMAERMIRQGNPNKVQPEKHAQPVSFERQSHSFASSSVNTPLVTSQQQNSTPTPAPLPTPQSLYIGQLNSIGSELGPALTNDFYSFHADSKAAAVERVASSANQEVAPQFSSPISSDQVGYQQQSVTDIARKLDLQPNSQNDLDSAAQTRNSRHEPQPGTETNAFQHQNTLRFDITQPSNLNGPPLPPLAQHSINQSPDNLVRQFRQQTGSNLDNGQFLTSTLVPISVNSEQFWRPGNSGDQQNEGGNNINQQYNLVRGSNVQPQSLPPLPAPRFQSLSPPAQFSHPAPLPRQQSSQIHFAGHTFVPTTSQAQFHQPQLPGNNNRDRSFSSTSTPMISVLSGSDTSVGNSVSWNPPANINPPLPPVSQPQSQQSFNQQFLTSTQSSRPPNDGAAQSYYPSPSRGSSSPLVGGSFQPLPDDRPNLTRNSLTSQLIQKSPSSTFFISTDTNSQPETSTEVRAFPPIIATTQRAIPNSIQAIPEREFASSELQSSIRSSKNQRNFSPNDLAEFTSTSSSIYNDQSRTSRTPVATTVATTTSPTTTAASIPTNSTKKDDMVIYYYYYYDDNKNATVVAKNVTSRPPTLDEAIEADGGVEDTPYVDDPAPVTNLRTSSFRPTTTSTTTTTTTTLSPISTSSRSSQTINEDRPKNQIAANSRFQISSNETPHSRVAHSSELTNEELQNSANFNQDDLRHTSSPTIRVPSVHLGKIVSDTANSIAPTPIHVPSTSTSTSRSSGRASSPSISNDVFTNTRFTSTESSSSSRASPDSSSLASIPPKQKSQNGFAHNVSNNPSTVQTRPSNNLSTVSAHVEPSATSNRGHLSNASRYGTTNNIQMDPYGSDPTAPATVLQPGHSFTNDVLLSSQHKNWQPTHSVRKPASGPASTNDSSQTTPKIQTLSGSRTSINQNFSSQRSSSNATNHNQAQPKISQPFAPTQQATRSHSGQNSIQGTRQTFPETSSSTLVDKISNDVAARVSQVAPKQVTLDRQLSNQIQKQQSGKNQLVVTSTEGTFTRSSSPTPDENRELLARLNLNGRPSTPEGNTGNGFTRSPIQAISAASSFAVSSTTQKSQNNERVPLIASSPVSSTPSSKLISPQQTLISTSVSQTITSSSPKTTPVSTFSSLSSTSSTSSSSSYPQTIPTSSTSSSVSEATTLSQINSSSTSAPQENHSSTESSDSATGITRKRFGNRNNRFQTRLSSISGSNSRSTSTTSTTQPPSSTSTTRRPAVSTTRKTSRQLFAGRRRLSSFNQQEVSSQPTNPVSVQSDTSSTPQNVETPVTTVTPSSAPSRARFGNNFTPKSKSSTSIPVVGPEQSSPTLRPTSLFGAQRTNKARLPFLKPSKQVASTSGSESTTSSIDAASVINKESPDLVASSFNSEKLASDKSSEPQEDTPSEPSSSNAVEDDNEEKKDSTITTNSHPVSEASITTTTSSSTTTEVSTTARNKLKVRPLFASRQRNTTLFGNRRTNNTSTS